MKLINRLTDMFRHRGNAIKEVQDITEKMDRNLRMARKQYNELRDMNAIISGAVHEVVDGFIWKKDSIGRYIFANRAFCNNLLLPDMSGIENTKECTSVILGHTDEEIFSQYTMRTGDINSFWDTIPIADKYVANALTSTKIIEFGEINKKTVAIESIRTPLFTQDGEFEGISCFALDASDHCGMLWDKIKYWHKKDLILNIHPSIFVILNRDDSMCKPPEDFFDFEE